MLGVVYIPHNTVDGAYVNPKTYEAFDYVGNGSLAEIPEGESNGAYNGPLTFELAENGEYYIVSYCDEEAVSVVIPETYNGLPVKEIGYEAFYYCSELTDVTIPDTVTKICEFAFMCCYNLSNVNLPESLILSVIAPLLIVSPLPK